VLVPNRDRAVIAPEKLRDYLLNPEHRRGGSKARVLLAMGFRSDNWQALESELRVEDWIAASPVYASSASASWAEPALYAQRQGCPSLSLTRRLPRSGNVAKRHAGCRPRRRVKDPFVPARWSLRRSVAEPVLDVSRIASWLFSVPSCLRAYVPSAAWLRRYCPLRARIVVQFVATGTLRNAPRPHSTLATPEPPSEGQQ
jgi:hypothetical protein